MSWEDTGEKVQLPMMREEVAKHANSLSGTAVGTVPALVPRLETIGRALLGGGGTAEDSTRAGQTLVAMAVSVALHEHGWRVVTSPGEPIRLRHGEAMVEPFADLGLLTTGGLSAEAWVARFEALGVAAAPLTPAEATPRAGP